MNFDAMTRRNFLYTAAMSGLAAAGVSTTFVGAAEAAGGKELNTRYYGTFDSLDPGYMVGGTPDYEVNWCINPCLAHYGKDSNGALTFRTTAHCEKLVQRDETHIDFTLTPGLMWSNGFGELTTEDVKYSYERMATSEWKGNYDAFSHVDIIDKYNGTIVLKFPFAPFIVTTLASGTGVIICKKATESVGGKFGIKIPSTCGPYVFESKENQYIKLTRNPEWTGAKPAYDLITIYRIDEDNAAALAYEAGEIDCSKIQVSTYERYKKTPPPHTKLVVAGALQYMWMGLNTEHPKLKNPLVRKAIQYAVDASAVNAGAYGGTGEPSYGVVCPGLVGKRNETKYSYDPAKAKALLAEAGVSGLELTIRVKNIQEQILSATIIQANLQAIGVKLAVLPMDSGPYWDMGQESKGDTWKDLELWIMRYSSMADPYEPMQWFVGSQKGIWQWERWTSEEFDKLYDQGNKETDSAKRNEIYLRMQEIMEDTGGYVWLIHEPEVWAHRDTIEIDVAPSGELQILYSKPA